MARFDGYAAPRGPSIIDLIWQELDACYAKLMERPPLPERLKLQGICAGLGSAIAIIRNPANPDEDIIREEAAERYVSR